MHILALDPKHAHRFEPNCRGRLIRKPDGGWMCIDCGMAIATVHIDTHTPEIREAILAARQANLQEMALKRAEEGVMTPHEVTPVGPARDAPNGTRLRQDGARVLQALTDWREDLLRHIHAHGHEDNAVRTLQRLDEILWADLP